MWCWGGWCYGRGPGGYGAEELGDRGGDFQQAAVGAVGADELEADRQAGRGRGRQGRAGRGRGERGRGGLGQACGEGDGGVGAYRDPGTGAHPVDIGGHRLAVDLADPLGVHVERDDLHGGQGEHVIAPVGQERADAFEDRGVPGPGGGDLLAGQRDALFDVPGQGGLDLVTVGVKHRRHGGHPRGPQDLEYLVRVGQVGRVVGDLAAGLLEPVAGRAQDRAHRGLHRQVAKVERPGHPQPGQRRGAQVQEVAGPVRPGQRQAGIGPAHPGQQQRGVGRGARDRADHAQRVERVGGHQAGRGPQPDQPAERGRVPDAGREVGTVRERDHRGGHGRGGPAAAAARGQPGVIRVAGGAEDRVERLRPGTELRRVRLPDHHRAGSLEQRDVRRVEGRHVAGEDRRPVRGPDPGRLGQVLDRDRQPVQRAGELAAGGPRVQAGRDGPGLLGGERDNRVDRGVDRVDPGQRGLEQLGGRQPPGPDQPGQVGGRGRVQLHPAITSRR